MAPEQLHNIFTRRIQFEIYVQFDFNETAHVLDTSRKSKWLNADIYLYGYVSLPSGSYKPLFVVPHQWSPIGTFTCKPHNLNLNFDCVLSRRGKENVLLVVEDFWD